MLGWLGLWLFCWLCGGLICLGFFVGVGVLCFWFWVSFCFFYVFVWFCDGLCVGGWCGVWIVLVCWLCWWWLICWLFRVLLWWIGCLVGGLCGSDWLRIDLLLLGVGWRLVISWCCWVVWFLLMILIVLLGFVCWKCVVGLLLDWVLMVLG